MTERSRRSAESTGWLATLGGAVLLVVIGFAIGLVAGAAFEEPELVVAPLRGQSTDVRLEAVAGEAPSAVGSRGPAVVAPPPVAGAAPGGSVVSPVARGLSVQVGAFVQQAAAERLAETLRAAGLPGYVAPEVSDGRARFRVRVGPVADEGQAQRLAKRLQTQHGLPTWVVEEEGG